MSSKLAGERGGATVVLVWWCAAIVALALAVLAAIGSVAAGARAQAIADLAALHGAGSHVAGGAGCEAAAEVVARNRIGGAHPGVRLIRCDIEGAEVEIGVETTGPWRLEARARAGPWWSAAGG